MPAAVISQPLVLPTRQEARLNGVRPVQSAQPVDPRKQIEAAITAFERTHPHRCDRQRPAGGGPRYAVYRQEPFPSGQRSAYYDP
jgi:hypothetical protein